MTDDLDPEALKIFGENVRSERLLRGWSLQRLAHLCGMATDTVFRVEKGSPSMKKTRVKISKALQSSYDRMLMKPQVAGHGYAIHRASEDWWVVHWGRRPYRHLEEEAERIQEAAERERLGGVGFVSHFVKMLNCRLPKGKLVAGILEIYGEGAKSRYLAGEVIAYVLEGTVRVCIGDDEFTLEQGEAATIQCSAAEFYFAPHAGGPVPSRLLYVRLDAGTEDQQMKEEELATFIRKWESDTVADAP